MDLMLIVNGFVGNRGDVPLTLIGLNDHADSRLDVMLLE